MIRGTGTGTYGAQQAQDGPRAGQRLRRAQQCRTPRLLAMCFGIVDARGATRVVEPLFLRAPPPSRLVLHHQVRSDKCFIAHAARIWPWPPHL